MKQLFTIFLMLMAFTLQAQVSVPEKAADLLVLKETSYDFGKIQQGRPVTHIFEIKNSAKDAIRLENVQASCGCTTPEWSSEPIQPGATTTIKVGYNAASEGGFNKTISVMYNGNQVKTITITGTVYKAPAASAPANGSISLFKPSNQ